MTLPANETFVASLIARPGLPVVLRYLAFSVAANLLWESAHLPLYTVWNESDFGFLVFTVAHCTGGDVLIALSAFALAFILVGHTQWPRRRFTAVATLTVVFGLAYTVFSEWVNVVVRQTWAYSDLMPVIPVINSGLSPIAQWLVIPVVGLAWARCTTKSRSSS